MLYSVYHAKEICTEIIDKSRLCDQVVVTRPGGHHTLIELKARWMVALLRKVGMLRLISQYNVWSVQRHDVYGLRGSFNGNKLVEGAPARKTSFLKKYIFYRGFNPDDHKEWSLFSKSTVYLDWNYFPLIISLSTIPMNFHFFFSKCSES